MAFMKTGDPSPVIKYYDADGDITICPKCGKELSMVFLDDENKLICEDCDIDEENSE